MKSDSTIHNVPSCRSVAAAGRTSIGSIRERVRSYSYKPIASDDNALSAAVLVPLYRLGDELHVVFTKRTMLLRTQQGHISFPGGRREPGDRDLLGTALRESFEEIGLDPGRVEIFGRMDDFWTRGGQTLVAAFVGLIDPLISPYPWRPAEAEVAEILEVPVRHVLDPLNRTVAEPRQLNGRLWPNETFLFGEHRVFGATARALRNLLDVAFGEG